MSSISFNDVCSKIRTAIPLSQNSSQWEEKFETILQKFEEMHKIQEEERSHINAVIEVFQTNIKQLRVGIDGIMQGETLTEKERELFETVRKLVGETEYVISQQTQLQEKGINLENDSRKTQVLLEIYVPLIQEIFANEKQLLEESER